MNRKKFRTDFLFVTPTFLTGAGSVLNLAGNYYEFNTSESGYEADCMAIKSDFDMIGQDIQEVFTKIQGKQKPVI